MKKIVKPSEYRCVIGVYLIKNIVNNKVYVGSTSDLYDRIRVHKRDLNADKHHSVHLQRAWQLYGSEAFEFYLLELVEDALNLLDREQHWMDHFESHNKRKGYNISPTAGSCRGIKLSESHKEKLRQAHLGKVISQETRRKISEVLKERCYWIGKQHSRQTKDKISATKTGEKHSRETCEKRNHSIRRGENRSGIYKGVSWDGTKKKWVAQMKVNRKGVFLGRFDDPKDAAENYDYHTRHLFPEAYLNFPEKDYDNFDPKRKIKVTEMGDKKV